MLRGVCGVLCVVYDVFFCVFTSFFFCVCVCVCGWVGALCLFSSRFTVSVISNLIYFSSLRIA